MNPLIRLFVNSLAAVTLLFGCGAQVDQASATNDSSSVSTGGTSNVGTSQVNGGAMGTGGATGPDPSYCNGLLLQQRCGEYRTNTDLGPISCEVTLKYSPLDIQLSHVFIDCEPQPLVGWNKVDAGVVDGFTIDYNYEPAHLVLLGTSCEVLQSPGYHALDFFQGCQCVC